MAPAAFGIRERLRGLGFTAGWSLAKAMPQRLAQRCFAAGAEAAYRRNGAGIQQLRRNLCRVTGSDPGDPELDLLVEASMRSYARYWLETFRLASMDPLMVSRACTSEGAELIDSAVAAGKGVILALPHSGNWDVAGIWLRHRGYPFTTVAERLKPESVFRKFVEYRESLGMEVIPLTGGPTSAMDVLKDRLQAGGVVCLLADRDLGRNGVEVSFFGEAATMPPGPALLAATTGAALLTVHPYYDGAGWGLTVEGPISGGVGNLRTRIGTATQQMADNFQRQIAAKPVDWHMLQPFWKQDFPAEPAKPRTSAT